MDPVTQLDAAGRRRSPATLPGYHTGRAPQNKGRSYPADPPRVEEIVAVMRQAGERPAGLRFRGLAVILWRAGLRISEALALSEGDLEPRRGAMLVRHGKGGKRREVGMDDWGWQQLDPLAEVQDGAACWRAFLCGQRVHSGKAVVGRRGTNAIPTPGAQSRCSPPLRTAPAAARPRR